MKKRIPYFDYFQEIWGSKASLNVPFSSTSSQIGPCSTESTGMGVVVEDIPFDLSTFENETYVNDFTNYQGNFVN